jgi:hypothetical protein
LEADFLFFLEGFLADVFFVAFFVAIFYSPSISALIKVLGIGNFSTLVMVWSTTESLGIFTHSHKNRTAKLDLLQLFVI